jgi:hypothetical protein
MKRSIVMVIWLAGAVAAPPGAVTTPADASSSAGAPRTHPTTFSGHCALSGVVRFEPPLVVAPRPAQDIAAAVGTCTGTLTDPAGHASRLTRAPVSYLASDTAASVSCALGIGARGAGRLVFPSATLDFKLSETRAAAVAALELAGSRGGGAIGAATVSPRANPIELVQACADGGLGQVPVDIRLQTITPLSG